MRIRNFDPSLDCYALLVVSSLEKPLRMRDRANHEVLQC